MSNEYFLDSLYGKISFDPLINDIILSCPELLRLKEIRMSNIDFTLFPSFAGINRFEHSIGTGYLAKIFAERQNLDKKDKYELIISALFHDIATPPFGHCFESIVNQYFNFDHEKEGANIILGKRSDFVTTKFYPVFGGKIPQLHNMIKKINQVNKINLEIKNIYDNIYGNGKFRSLINAEIDLDNIDNVLRAANHLGFNFDKTLPIKITENFSYDKNIGILYNISNIELIKKWLEIRKKLYTEILLNTYDFKKETMLKYAIEKGILNKIIHLRNYLLTDYELIDLLIKGSPETKEIITRMRLGSNELFKEIGFFWISNKTFIDNVISSPKYLKELEKKLTNLLGINIVINYNLDRRSRRISDLNYFEEIKFFKKSKRYKIGEQENNILIGIFSPQKSLIKKGSDGKAILDSNKKQIILNRDNLRGECLKKLKKYTNNDIVLFDRKLID